MNDIVAVCVCLQVIGIVSWFCFDALIRTLEGKRPVVALFRDANCRHEVVNFSTATSNS